MSEMEEFKQIFFAECAELLTDMEDRLMKLEVGVTDKEAFNAIFRAAHSIKGGSGAFGFEAMMQFTHVAEALLDTFREGKQMPTQESTDALLKSVDIITQMLNQYKQGQAPAAGFGGDVLAILKNCAEGKGGASIEKPKPIEAPKPVPAATGVKKKYNIEFSPHPTMLVTGNEPVLILQELSRLGAAIIMADVFSMPLLGDLDPVRCYTKWLIALTSEADKKSIMEVFEFVEGVADITITETIADPEEQKALEVPVETAAVQTTPEVANPAAPVAAKAEEAKPAAAAPAIASIRVDLDKIDRLVNMVGELVITEAMIRAQMRDLPMEKFTDLLKGVDELSHHTRELQEAVMSVRMQPVKSIFSRMPRIVRDTSGQLGKNIQLILSGENTEVDKTVIEQLSDPLTHMIRNSVDHGIEMPAVRVERGKPEQGTIRLSAYQRSGQIIIEIEDDGNGINREKVLAKAKEKGLVAADANLAPEEIDQLIFLPGFSTAEKVTSVSGRGVGTDVVRRNIEALGGTVRITNMPGKGSIFTVSLPLTLAILDGMITRVGVENYIIPITSIIETLRPRAEQVHAVQGRGDVINVRGEFVPLIYLHTVFNVQNAIISASDGLVVLVEAGKQKLGVVVDELIGQQQVVIKSLEENADPVKGISGATILGDGKVSLILEINELKSLSNNYLARPAPNLSTQHSAA